MVDAWNRDVGFTYKPKKAKVAPIHPGQDDWRSTHLRNSFINNVNEERKHKATFGNADWLGSRPANWYTQLDAQGKPSNWRAAKNVLQHIPAVTTDQNETRNMFQMLANQAKGGDKGARMLDTRGLPAGARRIGRTLFTDPAKSQGFFGDVGALFSGKNKAAVRAKEYNPFPKAGFGEQFYKDEFPFASSFGNLIGLAEKSPTLSMIASLFPKKERIPLEQDLSWVPEGLGEYDKIPEIPFLEDLTETIEEETIDDRIPRGPFPPGIAYPGYNADITITDLPPETFEKPTDEIFNEEVFNKVYKFPDPTGFTNFPYAFDAPWNLFEAAKENMEEGEWTDQELLDRLIKRGYLIDKTGGEDLEKISHDDLLKESSELEDWMKILGDQHRADSFSRHEIHSPVLDSDSLYYDKNVITPDALDMLESLQPLLLKKGVEI